MTQGTSSSLIWATLRSVGMLVVRPCLFLILLLVKQYLYNISYYRKLGQCHTNTLSPDFLGTHRKQLHKVECPVSVPQFNIFLHLMISVCDLRSILSVLNFLHLKFFSILCSNALLHGKIPVGDLSIYVDVPDLRTCMYKILPLVKHTMHTIHIHTFHRSKIYHVTLGYGIRHKICKSAKHVVKRYE